MNYVQTLTRYKAWGDKLFLAAVSRLPAVELTAPQPIVFGSLIRTLHHVWAMDYVWRCHLLGKLHGLVTRNPEDCPDAVRLVVHQHKMDQWYVNYADALSEPALGEVVEFEFIGGGRSTMTRRDILLHVVNHTTYHR
ncbi:MAG: DinB family protein, partial [Gammaproteobacteria bacterium]